jgi:parallel beta-helix repeat protein
MAAKILAIGMIGLMLLVALGGCLDGGDDGGGGGNGGGNGGEDNAPTNPTGVVITDVDDGFITIEWNPISGVTSYNIYWSTDGTPVYGEKIAGVSSPYTHTGLMNYGTYSYIVTSLIGTWESDKYDASEVAATPPGPQNGGPIRIKSDDHFTSANGVTGGSGTEADPYIIEGWTIDASPLDMNSWPYTKTAIEIYDASKHFTIRNCTVLNAIGPYGYGGSGISLSFVSNGKVQDCSLDNCGYGISVDGCLNVEISSSTIENCGDGISSGSYSSDGIIMSDNTITNCDDDGIEFHYLTNSTASGNTISDCSGSGIRASAIWEGRCTISNNTITGNSMAGIEVDDDSNNVTVSGNDASSNYEGIAVYGNYNKISDNVASNNGYDGIKLDFVSGGFYVAAYASYNTISGNTANGNGGNGIYIGSGCIYNTISGNTFLSNDKLNWPQDYYDVNIQDQPNTLSADNTYGTRYIAS